MYAWRSALLASTMLFAFGSLAPVQAQTPINTSQPYYLASGLGTTVLPDFQGGTLRMDQDSTTYSQTFTIENYTTNTFDTYGHTATLSGVLSGAGPVTVTGTGTLTLSKQNTYGGGTTILTGSTLELQGPPVTCIHNACSAGTPGSIAGDVVNNGKLVFSSGATITIVGNISGSGSLQVSPPAVVCGTNPVDCAYGLGTWNGGPSAILTGTNTYTGGTDIGLDGSLQIGNGGTTGSITGDVTGTWLTFKRSDTVTFDGNLNVDHLQQVGSGTLILTGTITGNPVWWPGSRAITISSGTVQVGDGSTTGSVTDAIDIINSGALIFNKSNTLEFLGTISGPGSLQKSGTGTLIISGGFAGGSPRGKNTYTGGTTISAGTLQIGNGGTYGSIIGDIINNGTLAFNHSDTYTFAGNISGTGSVTQIGTGTAILTGANTYTGGTTITAGTLQIGNGGTTGSITGNVSTEGRFGGTLAFNRSDTYTFAGNISGTGSVAQIGTGTTILNGNNTYSGGTTISAGTLQMGNGDTTGTIGIGDVLDNGALIFDRSDTYTFGRSISGTGSVAQIGTGTTILTGTNTYTGGTTIINGTLQIGSGGTTGSITGDVVDNNSLVFNRSDTYSFVGTISGTGSVNIAGTGTTVLSGNNTYQGTTTLASGTLRVGGTSPLGMCGGPVCISRLRITGNNTLVEAVTDATVSNKILVEPKVSTTFAATESHTLSLADIIAIYSPDYPYTAVHFGSPQHTGTVLVGEVSWQSGPIVVDGGTLALGSTTYPVSLADSYGVVVGTGSTAATLDLRGRSNSIELLNGNSFGVVLNNGAAATLSVGKQGAIGYGASVMSFAGVIKDGTGPLGLLIGNHRELTLSGHNSYSGQTTIESGTIRASAEGVFSPASDIVMADNYTTLDLNNFNQTVRSLSSRAGGMTIVKLGTATLTVRGDGDSSYGGMITGTGGLTKEGAGTLIFTGGSIDYTGITTISGGTFRIAPVWVHGDVLHGNVIDDATFEYDTWAGFDESGNPLGGPIYSGTISGTGTLITRPLLATGPGILTLIGTNTYTGGTTISAGILRLGNGGTTGSILGNVVDNGSLAFDRSDAYTFAGNISGTGAVAQIGTGATILAGTNTYTGVTTISAGTLQLGNGGSTGSIASDVTDNATLAFNRSDTLTYDAVISGTGVVNQIGTGATVLNGVNTYTGLTTLSAGTLMVGDASHTTAQIAGNVVINADATLRGHGTILGAVTNNGGTVAPGGSIGTLTVGSLTQSPNSVLTIEVGPDGMSSLVVTGQASLAGTLNIVAPTDFTGQSGNFLTAGSVTGSFSNIVTSGAPDAMLRLNFTSSGITVAAQSDRTGQIFGDVITAAIEDAHDLADRLVSHAGEACADSCAEWTIWGECFVGLAALDGRDHNADALNRHWAGFLGGTDYHLGNGASLGAAFSYRQSMLNVAAGWGKATVDSLSVALNGSTPLADGRLSGGLFYTSNAATSRSDLGASGVATAHPGGDAVGGTVQYGYPVGNGDFVPLVYVGLVRASRNATAEIGAGLFDLAASHQAFGSLRFGAGMTYNHRYITNNGMAVRPQARFVLRQEMESTGYGAELVANDLLTTTLSMPFARPDRTTAEFDVGVDIEFEEAITFNVSLQGIAGGHTSAGSIIVGGRIVL